MTTKRAAVVATKIDHYDISTETEVKLAKFIAEELGFKWEDTMRIELGANEGVTITMVLAHDEVLKAGYTWEHDK